MLADLSIERNFIVDVVDKKSKLLSSLLLGIFVFVVLLCRLAPATLMLRRIVGIAMVIKKTFNLTLLGTGT